jgi:hypothetical protein
MGRFAVCRSAGFALVLGLLAGCGSDGSYTVSWQFFTTADATADGDPMEPAAAACGKHGVDAILVSAVSADGGRHQTTALCAAGQLADGIGAGQWQFTFSQLDVRGAVIPLPEGAADPERSATVAEGGEPAKLEPDVVFIPQPACGDGVDNDRDGRIDLDDPDCGGDAAGKSEAPAPAAAQ